MAEFRLIYRDKTKRDAMRARTNLKQHFGSRTKVKLVRDPNGRYEVWVEGK